MIIKETFVSYDIALKLQQKGFDAPCLVHYHTKPRPYDEHKQQLSQLLLIRDDPKYILPAPTYQLALNFLRVVYDIDICIKPGIEIDNDGFFHKKGYIGLVFDSMGHNTVVVQEEKYDKCLELCIDSALDQIPDKKNKNYGKTTR